MSMKEDGSCKYTCTQVETKDDYDFILKCIILGDSNVGKTSILHRMTNQGFILNQTPTIGIDFGTIYAKLSNQKTIKKNLTELENLVSEESQNTSDSTYVKVQIWDCAGQVRFRSIVQSYFRQAQIVLFVYDTNYGKSFESLSEWIMTVDNHIGRGNYVGCIIANKSDLSPVVEFPLIKRFCEINKDFTYYSLSAKEDKSQNILKPLIDCTLKAYDKYEKGEIIISKPYWRDSTVDLYDDGFSDTAECISKCVIL